MQTASARFDATMTTSRVAALRVDSWLGGNLLASDIPVRAGSWEVDTGSKVPERLTLSVPALPEWIPNATRHPLADKGQRLRISRGVVLPDTGETEYISVGWVRIQSYEVEEGSVQIEGVGLGSVLDDARFFDPVQTSGTYLGAAISLVGGMFPVVAYVQDRDTTAKTWQDNRLDALYELADTWPASLAFDQNGTLVFTPASNDASDGVVATFRDGEGGTVVTADRNSSRDGVYNAVKASGEDSGEAPPVSAIVVDDDYTSPTLWNGPYGQVPLFYSSPLLTTVEACQAAARTRLGNVKRTSVGFTVTAALDPRTQVRDVVRLTSADVNGLGRIDALSFDLPPGATGTMRLRGHLIPGRV